MKKIFYFVVVLLLIWYLFYHFSLEAFSENDKFDIDYYVITMGNKDRLLNIEKQQEKIKEKIRKIDAVVGAKLNIDELVESGLVTPEYGIGERSENRSEKRKREIGLSLSNLKVHNIIKETNKPNGYSLIFEDDFSIIDENFQETLNNSLEILKDIDFDLLYLQNNAYGSKNKGDNIKENVYYVDKNDSFYGTVAVLVKNKSIDKIIQNTTPINDPLDLQLSSLGFSDKLILLTLYPIIVEQGENMPTTIQ